MTGKEFLEKYPLPDDAVTVGDVFGVEQERGKELTGLVEELLNKEETTDWRDVITEAFNECKNVNELLVVVFVIGRYYEEWKIKASMREALAGLLIGLSSHNKQEKN